MDDGSVDFPFKVSPMEQEIIDQPMPPSVILLGRSGTGKTTCAVFRMWSRFHAKHLENKTIHQVGLMLYWQT